MRRIADLTADQLSSEQRRIHDEVAASRGGAVRGPFAVWLRIPRIAEAADRLGNCVRLESAIERRLLELAILMVARYWNAQYEWFVHEREGLEAGLAHDVIDALRRDQLPAFSRDDEKLVFDVVSELHRTRTISHATFDRAVAALGLDPFIELVTGVGFYTLAAMTINTFDIPVPGNVPVFTPQS